MKKLLIALLCVLCARGAYSDGDQDIFKQVAHLKADYLTGKVDLETAQTICRAMFTYADSRDIEIIISKKYYPKVQWCDDDDFETIVDIVLESAEYLKSFVEQVSMTDCEKEAKARANNSAWLHSKAYRQTGLVNQSLDTNNFITFCSVEDNRCVVNIPTLPNSEHIKYLIYCFKVDNWCNNQSNFLSQSVNTRSHYLRNLQSFDNNCEKLY